MVVRAAIILCMAVLRQPGAALLHVEHIRRWYRVLWKATLGCRKSSFLCKPPFVVGCPQVTEGRVTCIASLQLRQGIPRAEPEGWKHDSRWSDDAAFLWIWLYKVGFVTPLRSLFVASIHLTSACDCADSLHCSHRRAFVTATCWSGGRFDSLRRCWHECFLRGAKKGAPPDRVRNPSTFRYGIAFCRKHTSYRMPIRRESYIPPPMQRARTSVLFSRHAPRFVVFSGCSLLRCKTYLECSCID